MLSSKCVTKVLHVSIFNRIKSIFPESQGKKTANSAVSSCIIDIGMPYAAF